MQAIVKLIATGLLTTTSVVALPTNSSDDSSHGPPWVVPFHKEWTNATCYWDLYADDRQLPIRTSPPFLPGNPMTVNKCVNHCEALNYTFAGLEFGSDCYCGNERPAQRWVQVHALGEDWNVTKCNFACTGDHLQVCGGDQSLLVYELIKPASHVDINVTRSNAA
ncbi:unnamed protein product [Discula destructiva]